MTRTELAAAGITDPVLQAAYARCRALHAAHGRTYFLATRLLTPARRPAIHALYGFARRVDDIVDDPDPHRDAPTRTGELTRLTTELRNALAGNGSGDPVISAVADTTRRYGIDGSLFETFLGSMRDDLHTTDYPNRAALDRYIHGSAEAIGLQVLPVLGTVTSMPEASRYAAALGNAFQLTNFLRDVGEDRDRGRLYLPADELAAFGVDRQRLLRCRRTGQPDAPVRRALADQVARARAMYRAAAPGLAMLVPESRPCVSTAFVLYGEILDRIVESGYAVFGHRATVPRLRQLGVALPAVAQTAAARARSAVGLR